MKKTLFLTLMLSAFLVKAQQKANFKAAEKFSAKNMEKMLKSTRVNPRWFKDSDKFWYTYTTTEGKRFYVIDPAKKSRSLMFDNQDFAAQLSELTRTPWNHNDLNLEALKLEEDNRTLTFMVDSIDYHFDLNTKTLTQGDSTEKEDKKPDWAGYAPDSSYVAFARRHNLYLMEVGDKDSTEIQLTTDGERWFSYQADQGDTTSDERLPARVQWFKDSKKLYVSRSDERKVKELFVINELSEPRPELEVYKYPMPGDREVPREVLEVFDIESKKRLKVNIDKFKDQTIRPYLPGKTSEKLFFTRMNRTSDTLDVCVVNTMNGEVKQLFQDVNHPYFNWSYQQLAILNEGEELIWWSERSGWGQLYLYDGHTGDQKNKITRGGHFTTGRIAQIDTLGRKVYFQAFGREPGIDPYYSLIYKANLDGSGFTALSVENGNHQIEMSESARYYVDNYSAVDMAPASVLKDSNGRVIMNLETADLSLLKQAGWKMPERFTVKADDGITDLYGVMYKPFDFDATRKYPIISYVYPGPQVESFSNDFTIRRYNIAMAQLGFIVVSMGHRGGSPMRSKYYHTYGYQNLRDYALADDKRSLEQLADRHSFIDLNHVGIFGHSGGGFMSTAALLSYPDFYDAAASSAGNHDNNIYNRWWSETHNGVTREEKTEEDDEDNEHRETLWDARIETNPSLAQNLKGHLLITHGTIDNNVHPGNSMRLVSELMKAGKRFEYVPIPGERHGYGRHRDYYERLMWYFFAEHLMDDHRNNIDIHLPEE